MGDLDKPLWPFGSRAALLAAPLIWLMVALFLAMTRRLLSLPGPDIAGPVLAAGAAIGLVPLLLLFIDYIALSRGSLDIKGIKIDFSQAEIRRVAIELPSNIGRPGAIVVDSSPMQVVGALEEAIFNPIARLDLRDGDAWWVTRLMALSAGAERAGSPRAFVFVGMKENEDGAFLGWGSPTSVLRAIRGDNTKRGPQKVTYGDVYTKAFRIAKQVAILADPHKPDVPPYSVGPWTFPDKLAPQVLRYLSNPDYQKLGDAALEQILMDQLALYGLEDPPDRLTPGHLNELLGHCLYHSTVDLESPSDQQISTFLDSNAPYLATVRRGRYEGLVERVAVERIILRELFTRSKRK